MVHKLSLGALCQRDGSCRFKVWAPHLKRVAVHIVEPFEKTVPLARDKHGYFSGIVSGVKPGTLYYYLLNGEKKRPDPASRHQPRGVHGPSQVIDGNAFNWSDNNWFGISRPKLVFYELHVGTFTPEGTFEAIIPRLDELKDLGITAIELMPLAQFPGDRNWGYDGAYLFAVQDSYGGPEGLRQLVDACHQRGLAVFIDVVYNHLGPEGNYLGDYGPYFTGRYHTPWGNAINFDGPYSDEVRCFFVENALYWINEYHIDGLRLDAIHAIMDMSAYTFLQELNDTVHRCAELLGRRVHLIAESDLNDARVINHRSAGGYGLDAQWTDDFHHSLHALLTKERQGYYQDFGTIRQLAKVFETGYVYTGQYSWFRQRRHGNSPVLCDADQFVVFAQNHDQVGNRAQGDRLSALLPYDGIKLAACVVFFSPFIPLVFMGEEYGETAPFLYFTSHTDPGLIKAVRKGRSEEFAAFEWGDDVPDPQDETTFESSRLNHHLKQEMNHRTLWEFYAQLVRLRREIPALADLNRENLEAVVFDREMLMFLRRWSGESEICAVFNFAGPEHVMSTKVTLPIPPGCWEKVLDTAEERWLGVGTTLPIELESKGEVTITMPPFSCFLIRRLKED